MITRMRTPSPVMPAEAIMMIVSVVKKSPEVVSEAAIDVVIVVVESKLAVDSAVINVEPSSVGVLIKVEESWVIVVFF